MFRFHHSSLPQITRAKALIAVDLQNDFLADNGALTVDNPNSLSCRIVNLADAYRATGDVVWVTTEFKGVRPEYEDTILVTDHTTQHRHDDDGVTLPIDAEAFLSSAETACGRLGSSGVNMPDLIQKCIQKRDIMVTKSHYSSFEDTALLRLLRGRMVMDVVLCGSLINVGVYATALAAAGHGMNITIAEDCCGFRTHERRSAAMKKLLGLLGCTFTTSESIIRDLPPVPELKNRGTSSQSPAAKNCNIVHSMSALDLSKQPAPPQAPSLEANSEAVSSKQPVAVERSELRGTQKMLLELSKHVKRVNGNSLNTKISDKDAAGMQDTLHSSTSSAPGIHTTPRQFRSDSTMEEPTYDMRGLCEGDTHVIANVLPEELAGEAFQKLQDEVDWQRMSHQGGEVPRLVAVQGEVSEDGSFPVYRHPSDESPKLLPFSPTVLSIKAETERHLGHSLNHVLIQCYRDGKDYISEHSDKTLDIVPNTFIANVSLGAQRTMVLRTKRAGKNASHSIPQPGEIKRQVQRADLPHNSLCMMGLRTNMKWLHSIRQDKRADRDKTQAEVEFSGARISLTFRQIGTYLNSDQTLIWGQGASGKTCNEAGSVVNGQCSEAVKLLRAFGTENRSSNFDWNTSYGTGFNVLHFQTSPRFFASTLEIVDLPIVLMFHEYGIGCARGSISPKDDRSDIVERVHAASRAVKYIDNDADKSCVQGDISIMLYVDSQTSKGGDTDDKQAQILSKFQQAQTLRTKWLSWKASDDKEGCVSSLQSELKGWNDVLGNSTFCVSDSPTLPDFLVWSVLEDITQAWGEGFVHNFSNISKYWRQMGEREAAVKALEQVSSYKDGFRSINNT